MMLATSVASPPTLPCDDAADLPILAESDAPQIDAAAMALLQVSGAAMLALTSYRAECRASGFYWTPTEKPLLTHHELSTLTAEKPNRMRYDKWMLTEKTQNLWEPTDAPRFTFVCDGNAVWRQFGKILQKNTRVNLAAVDTLLEPWDGFYAATSSPYQMAAYLQSYSQIGQLMEARHDGSETIESVLCETVFVHTRMRHENKTQEHRTLWYIGGDGLVRRRIHQARLEGATGFVHDAVVRRIETNAPIVNPETVFVYVPPPGVALRENT